jgi:hypothetical protein
MPYRDHPMVQSGAAWFREYPQIVRIATEKKGCQCLVWRMEVALDNQILGIYL